MIDFRVAVRTTVLVVDKDIGHLELRNRAMEMSGFSVINASGPREAISIINGNALRKIDVAVLAYHLPVMNGCILAEYLKDQYPELKIILYSSVLDIPEEEMSNIDAFVPKADGIRALLATIAEFGARDSLCPGIVSAENSAFIHVLN